MKKPICLLLAIALLCTAFFAGCNSSSPVQEEPTTDAAPITETEGMKEWTREGYFTDENEYFLSVTYMDDVDEPGCVVQGTVLWPTATNSLIFDLFSL